MKPDDTADGKGESPRIGVPAGEDLVLADWIIREAAPIMDHLRAVIGDVVAVSDHCMNRWIGPGHGDSPRRRHGPEELSKRLQEQQHRIAGVNLSLEIIECESVTGADIRIKISELREHISIIAARLGPLPKA